MENLPKRIYPGDNFIVKANDGSEKLLRIVDDSGPRSPRGWCNIGTMVCWHRNYKLGDKNPYHDPEDFLRSLAGKESDADLSMEDLIILAQTNYVILPLYLYDHSGISMSTGRSYPYDDPWDSGQVGYIYVSEEDTLKDLTCAKESWREIAAIHLEGEVEAYNDYLTGSVLGFQLYTIKSDGEVDEMEDSCYGFFGNDTERNGILDDFTVVGPAEVREETFRQTWVTNHTKTV